MAVKCEICGAELKKDWIGLNKKLVSRDATSFYCINCLAETFECDVSDLEEMIKKFKEDGCVLFG